MYNSCKLRGRIIEKYKTIGDFADEMKMTRATMSGRLKSGTWKQSEILKAAKLLEIPPQKIHLYFFVNTVKQNLTKDEDE